MRFSVDLFSPREVRGARVLALAAAAVLVAAAAYVGLQRPSDPLQPPPDRPAASVAAWTFLSPAAGWVVVDDNRQAGNRVWSTSDGGRTWRPRGRLPDGVVAELSFASPSTGYALVLEDGSSARPHSLLTADGGMQWEPLPGRPRLAPAQAGYFDGHVAIAETDRRTLMRSDDGGGHWKALLLPWLR